MLRETITTSRRSSVTYLSKWLDLAHDATGIVSIYGDWVFSGSNCWVFVLWETYIKRNMSSVLAINMLQSPITYTYVYRLVYFTAWYVIQYEETRQGCRPVVYHVATTILQSYLKFNNRSKKRFNVFNSFICKTET